MNDFEFLYEKKKKVEESVPLYQELEIPQYIPPPKEKKEIEYQIIEIQL